jgi:hypothetical protein
LQRGKRGGKEPGSIKIKLQRPQTCAHRSAEGEKMSNRTIVLLVLAVIAAAALTVEVTYFILDRFVLHNPNDPLLKRADYLRHRNRR